MTDKQRKKRLKILEYYGFKQQQEMLIEECSELILSIQKSKRYGTDISDNFLEELGDVLIMTEQIMLSLTREKLDKLERSIDYKLNRQILRIEGEA